VPGAFVKKVEAIANLRRRSLKDGLSVNIVLNGWNFRQLPQMMRFFFDKMGLSDLRVNFVRPEGYAEGNADLTPTYTEVVPILMKAIALNEYHFKKVFTFGGVPLCVLPAELLGSKNLLARYAGDIYRDLSTACSIRSEGPDMGVSKVEGGRARFNWQDRKRFDLKHHLDTCSRCDLTAVCEGVWKGYLEIYGGEELSALRPERGRLARERPLVVVQPTPSPEPPPRRFPVRLPVVME
jgi:MoaA/NifB/PqqE/SkfB family radical SAM enzyme